MLTANEVAERLRVSKQTITVLVRKGELKAVRVGNLLRFEESDIEEFIDRAKGAK